MKIAVFSDVHGNLKALQAVLKQIEERKPDLSVFLGDVFQRGTEETECLDLLKDTVSMCSNRNGLRHRYRGDPEIIRATALK